MITECYNWLWGLLFAGELPAILEPVAEESCVILTFIVVVLTFALPLYLLFRLSRLVFDLRFTK